MKGGGGGGGGGGEGGEVVEVRNREMCESFEGKRNNKLHPSYI